MPTPTSIRMIEGIFMALRNIVTVGDPVLTKVCRPVTKFDDRLS